MAAQRPWARSLSFCSGIVSSLVLLGLGSGALGRIYGQVPGIVPTLVALAVLMDSICSAWCRCSFSGPDPEQWRQRVPPALAPILRALPSAWPPPPAPPLSSRSFCLDRPIGHTPDRGSLAHGLRSGPGHAAAAGGHRRSLGTPATRSALRRPMGAPIS